MSKVTPFPSKKKSPQQAILEVESDISEMESVAIVYIRKGELHPRLTCSSMLPVDMNFLGLALSQYSLRYLKE